MSYIAGNPLLSQVRSLTEGVATSQQTAIPIIGGMVPGMSDVYVGGATLASGDYDDTSGTQIVLKKSMATGTQYRVICWSPATSVANNDATYLRRDGGNSMTGSLNFSATGQRIIGDMSNATASYRLAFQNSVANSPTLVGAIPNGTGQGSSFVAWGGPDLSNSNFAQLSINATQNAALNLSGIGAAASLPVNFSITNAGIARLTINGTNGTVGLYGAVQIQPNSGNTTLSNALIFSNANYAPSMRSNSTGLEWINSANTVVNMRLVDVGGLYLGLNPGNYTKLSIQGYGSGYAAGIVFTPVNDTATYPMVFANTAATTVGSISTTASATTYNTTSDYRLKQNVVDLTGGIDRIMQCRPVEFEWISSGQHSRGFLAHELADVVPDAVTGEKDGMSKDLDGNPIPAYQGVDSSFLIPDIVQALQDMRRQLDWALARIAYLEGSKT